MYWRLWRHLFLQQNRHQPLVALVQKVFIDGSLRDVLWIGLVLAMIVTIIFLRSLKASSVILLTIPVTLSATIATLYAFGYTLNIMTIGAITAAIGLIIDGIVPDGNAVECGKLYGNHQDHRHNRRKLHLHISAIFRIEAVGAEARRRDCLCHIDATYAEVDDRIGSDHCPIPACARHGNRGTDAPTTGDCYYRRTGDGASAAISRAADDFAYDRERERCDRKSIDSRDTLNSA